MCDFSKNLRKSSTDLLRSGQTRLDHVLFRPVELRLVLLPADVGVVEVDDQDQPGLVAVVEDLVLEAVVNDRPLREIYEDQSCDCYVGRCAMCRLPCQVSR